MASTYVARPLAEIDEQAWRADIDANLSSAFYVTHAVLPLLRARPQAHVVNFTDWLPASGRPGYTGFVAYYVAKAGVKALTEALALELASDNILVNAIAPGPIVPPPDLDEAERREVAEATPLQRWGGELEIARAVMLLVTTQFITGETLRVDGGTTRQVIQSSKFRMNGLPGSAEAGRSAWALLRVSRPGTRRGAEPSTLAPRFILNFEL